MAILNKFNSFVEALTEKKHNLGTDQLKVALSNVLPVAANAVLTDITEVSYAFCSTRNVVTLTSAQTAGLYKLTLTDLTLTATGGDIGPFRYVVLYNDTAASKELIGWYDYGSAVTVHDTETLIIDFDAVNGALQLQ